jgi:hypothetical protein
MRISCATGVEFRSENHGSADRPSSCICSHRSCPPHAEAHVFTPPPNARPRTFEPHAQALVPLGDERHHRGGGAVAAVRARGAGIHRQQAVPGLVGGLGGSLLGSVANPYSLNSTGGRIPSQ